MKYFSFHYAFIVLFIFAFNNIVLGQHYLNSSKSNNTNYSLMNNLEHIKICRWKDDARTSLVFSFYDNCNSHKKISEILDNYGFKGTFFVISSYMLVDSLKDIIAKGHEVGNHTYTHPNLTNMDSLQLDIEIRKSKEVIEKTFGIKCLSFAIPFGPNTKLSTKIAKMYHLFIMGITNYNDDNHIILSITPEASISRIRNSFNNALKSGSVLDIEGHGMDGDGWMPISKDLFVQSLDFIKYYVDKGDVWVSTVKETSCYENLYHEISLRRVIHGDTVILNFKNYNKEKYKDLDTSPISIEIPYILSKDVITITDSVRVRKANDKFVLTFDLKRDTSLIVLLKGYAERSDSLSKMLYKANFVYPNPVKDILNLRCKGKILSVEVYDMAGSRQINLPYNVSKIDVSQFAIGSYFIKAVAMNGITKTEYKDKFIKIK